MSKGRITAPVWCVYGSMCMYLHGIQVGAHNCDSEKLREGGSLRSLVCNLVETGHSLWSKPDASG